MRVGDCLEWLAGALFVLAAYLFAVGSRAALPILVAGVFLAYQAQCFAAHALKLPGLPGLPRLRLPRWLRRTPKPPKRDMSKVLVLPPKSPKKRKKGRRQ